MTEGIIDPETFGTRLRRLREARGLSQRSLAEPGVSYGYISRLERNERRASMKALRLLARRLDVSVEYLETGSPLRDSEERELRLSEAELQLRFEGTVAVAPLRQLLAEAGADGDHASASRARIALGLAAAAGGDHAEAIEQLEPMVSAGKVSSAARPDVHATLGRAYAAVGEPAKAVTLFRQGLHELDASGSEDTAARVRLSTYLSYALTDLGELEEARTVVARTLADAPETMDPYTRVRLYWSAGRVAQEQAKPRVALEHFRRAVALLGATEDSAHLARAHLSCAGAMIAARKDLAGAAEHIDKAEQLLGSHASPDDLVVIFRMRAMRSARAREFADAVEFATIAIDAADRMPNERGQATWALAEALAGLGDPNADRAFADAVELLTLHGTVRERAQALQAYGTYLEAEGDTAKAAAVRQSAAVTSAKLLERARPAKARIAT